MALGRRAAGRYGEGLFIELTADLPSTVLTRPPMPDSVEKVTIARVRGR
jgi:hypothetical protein